jgi:hypothetical protein
MAPVWIRLVADEFEMSTVVVVSNNSLSPLEHRRQGLLSRGRHAGDFISRIADIRYGPKLIMTSKTPHIKTIHATICNF